MTVKSTVFISKTFYSLMFWYWLKDQMLIAKSLFSEGQGSTFGLVEFESVKLCLDQ